MSFPLLVQLPRWSLLPLIVSIFASNTHCGHLQHRRLRAVESLKKLRTMNYFIIKSAAFVPSSCLFLRVVSCLLTAFLCCFVVNSVHEPWELHVVAKCRSERNAIIHCLIDMFTSSLPPVCLVSSSHKATPSIISLEGYKKLYYK